ncbi:MAG TPA: hypothetical protein VN840_06920 [Streptosporangiaceae bacterium]|nr:hypothetical protein [Streptosporangiaceae bacterium]
MPGGRGWVLAEPGRVPGGRGWALAGPRRVLAGRGWVLAAVRAGCSLAGAGCSLDRGG